MPGTAPTPSPPPALHGRRVRVTPLPGGVEVWRRCPRVPGTFFLMAWFTVWTYACVLLLNTALRRPDVGVVLGGVAMTAAWGFVAAILTWSWFGREWLRVRPEGVEYAITAGIKLHRRFVPPWEIAGVDGLTVRTTTGRNVHFGAGLRGVFREGPISPRAGAGAASPVERLIAESLRDGFTPSERQALAEVLRESVTAVCAPAAPHQAAREPAGSRVGIERDARGVHVVRRPRRDARALGGSRSSRSSTCSGTASSSWSG